MKIPFSHYGNQLKEFRVGGKRRLSENEKHQNNQDNQRPNATLSTQHIKSSISDRPYPFNFFKRLSSRCYWSILEYFVLHGNSISDKGNNNPPPTRFLRFPPF